jgi:hypothetical protein
MKEHGIGRSWLLIFDKMIHEINTTTDPLLQLIAGDPVRPNISINDRVNTNARVLVLTTENDDPQSVVCISFLNHIPTTEEDLFDNTVENPTVATLYTIWSLKPGGGQQMVVSALKWIKSNRPSVLRIVTLSPQTEMARRFHLKNGARELQVNANTVNFEYLI